MRFRRPSPRSRSCLDGILQAALTLDGWCGSTLVGAPASEARLVSASGTDRLGSEPCGGA